MKYNGINLRTHIKSLRRQSIGRFLIRFLKNLVSFSMAEEIVKSFVMMSAPNIRINTRLFTRRSRFLFVSVCLPLVVTRASDPSSVVARGPDQTDIAKAVHVPGRKTSSSTISVCARVCFAMFCYRFPSFGVVCTTPHR